MLVEIDDKGTRLSNLYRMQTCWGIPADKQRQKRMIESFDLSSYDKKVKNIAKRIVGRTLRAPQAGNCSKKE